MEEQMNNKPSCLFTRKYQQLKDEDESFAKGIATYMSGWFPGSAKTPYVDIDKLESLISL
jgi:hypothetical protein